MISLENHCDHTDIEADETPHLHEDVLSHLESLINRPWRP